MKFEVYCDESLPDLFTSKHAAYAKYLMIGGLWLPAAKRHGVKAAIKQLRSQYDTFGEMKWNKISTRRLGFYCALVDLFVEAGLDLRFRCIAVEANNVDLVRYHQSDQELGFYKFYYQLLHHWIDDFNEYAVFCDTKTNRKPDRLGILRECLANANISSVVSSVQAIPARQSALIQLVDVFLGAAGARLNDSIRPDTAKDRFASYLERHLGVPRLSGTPKEEQKFNVFVIQLQGGW